MGELQPGHLLSAGAMDQLEDFSKMVARAYNEKTDAEDERDEMETRLDLQRSLTKLAVTAQTQQKEEGDHQKSVMEKVLEKRQTRIDTESEKIERLR